ncbi:MAG: DUF3078 domain-containing protein [Chitinophagaceae bacterium]|nr:DUF3078 domain-containing protein [Chitinophagaceae bacterium]MCW5929779.1 DUF3078 domain-containing protein [Chitinophagaceae bacterium]
MKKITWNSLALLTLLMASSVSAQDETIKNLQSESGRKVAKDPNDTIPKMWKTGGLFNINLNQGSLSNWAAGGDRYSFSLATLANLYAFYKKDKHIWDNTLDLAYGIVNTTSLGNRKADDRVDLLSKYGYQISPKGWYVGGLVNFRTQFTKGYSYPSDNPKVLTSNSFAPAYVLVSPTISYQPNENFSVSLSPATARWTIVTDQELSNQGAFGVDPGKTSRTEFGAFGTISYKTNFAENISYAGRLDLFSNYLRDPQNIDLYMTNVLLMKVTKLITVSFSLDMIYDNDVASIDKDGNTRGPRTQLKQLLGVGVAYRFHN